jgi:hypothetical protein
MNSYAKESNSLPLRKVQKIYLGKTHLSVCNETEYIQNMYGKMLGCIMLVSTGLAREALNQDIKS